MLIRRLSVRALFISIRAFSISIHASLISICALFLFERLFEAIFEDYSYLIFHLRSKFDFVIQNALFCWRYSSISVVHVIIRVKCRDKVLIECTICIFEKVISLTNLFVFCLSFVYHLHEIWSSNQIDQNSRFRNMIWLLLIERFFVDDEALDWYELLVDDEEKMI